MFKKSLLVVAVVSAGLAATAQAADGGSESTTIGGKAFIDLTSLDAKSNGAKTAASGFGADVTRFYLTAAHSFDDMWSVNLTTDFNYTSSSGETQLYVKKAYVQYKVSDAFWLRAGSADLTWVPFAEDNYGYRYFEKVIIDRTGFGTSADWGLHAGGKSGMFAYAVSLFNGNGYKNPTRSKTMDLEARVSVTPAKGLTLALGTYAGKRGKDIEGTATPPVHTANRVNVLVNYTTGKFKVGGEYFTADNWNTVTSTASDKSDGYSLWAAANVGAQTAVFARVDSEKPSKDLAPTRKDDYYTGGLSYKPRKGIDLALALKHAESKTASATTSKSDEFGVWAQVAF